MTQNELYRISWGAARELLEGLERGDFDQVAEKLGRIRQYIDLAETVPAESLRGPALHHREQMELLAGITDDLGRALAGIRAKISGELQRVGVGRNLLRHLVTSKSRPIPRFEAAGCIWRAAPTE